MANIILLYGHYYNNRVKRAPEEYHKEMVDNLIGRMDLMEFALTREKTKTGAQTPWWECAAGVLWFRGHHGQVGWRLEGLRRKTMGLHAGGSQTMEMIGKMMRFLVEAGFNPDGLSFLKPMDRKSGTPQQKAEFRKHVSQFVQRLFTGTFPDKENYVYFRAASDGVNPGFSNCLELPVLNIIFAFRERSRSDEWSIAARQCGVILPKLLNDKVNYSIAKAEKETEKGKVNPFNILMPNLGEKSRQEAIASTAGDPVAERVRQSVQAGGDAASSSSANPSAKAPPSGETQRTKKQKRWVRRRRQVLLSGIWAWVIQSHSSIQFLPTFESVNPNLIHFCTLARWSAECDWSTVRMTLLLTAAVWSTDRDIT